MKTSLLRNQLLPFLLFFSTLIAATIVADVILHVFDLAWVGRYAGIPGTLLIIVSLLYSLRKRKIIQMGNPVHYLRLHEVLTWIGTLLVLIHAGFHFNSVLPWLALIAMLINVISGLVGRLLLMRSRAILSAQEEKYRARGMSKNETEKEIFWDSVTYDLMTKWRKIHFPIAYAFAILSLAHIISIFLFWGWK